MKLDPVQRKGFGLVPGLDDQKKIEPETRIYESLYARCPEKADVQHEYFPDTDPYGAELGGEG